MDGAEWQPSFVEIYYATEHLAGLLEALTTRGMAAPATILERGGHMLIYYGSGV